MGWCLPVVLAGQIYQRMKFNVCGCPATNGGYQSTCMIMTGLFVLYLVLYSTLMAIFPPNITFTTTSGGSVIYSSTPNPAYSVGFVFALCYFIALVRGRMEMRLRYEIRPDCCGEGCCGDCCVMYWCSCCALLQMHRHTHDEFQHRYHMCSNTGLAPNAPEIV